MIYNIDNKNIKILVRYINGNKLDNRKNNLEFILK